MVFQPPSSSARVDLLELNAPTIDFVRFDDFDTFRSAIDGLGSAHQYELELSRFICSAEQPPRLHGWCDVCGSDTEFRVPEGESWRAFKQAPNWRESLRCSRCGLNCRQRASVHAFRLSARGEEVDGIYLTERLSPLFDWFDRTYFYVLGSEFFGDDFVPGESYLREPHSVRHEDLTRLSFESASFSDVLSFDVLEHVPNVERALGEIYRVLKPEGRLMISVPFDLMSATTLIRARIGADGAIEHLEPPEYHGDPLVPRDGILCFYRFGWDLLDRLRRAGFVDASLLQYWAPGRGYLGWAQMLIVASRSDQVAKSR